MLMSSERQEEVATSKDTGKTIAYMALGVALATVVLLVVYVYRSISPVSIIKELESTQAATTADIQELERAVEGLTANINTIEKSLRSDRQAALVLDLKRSLIAIKELRRQAPASLRPKIEGLEERLTRLVNKVASPSPRKHIEAISSCTVPKLRGLARRETV